MIKSNFGITLLITRKPKLGFAKAKVHIKKLIFLLLDPDYSIVFSACWYLTQRHTYRKGYIIQDITTTNVFTALVAYHDMP